jgi:hypothetical protein
MKPCAKHYEKIACFVCHNVEDDKEAMEVLEVLALDLIKKWVRIYRKAEVDPDTLNIKGGK